MMYRSDASQFARSSRAVLDEAERLMRLAQQEPDERKRYELESAARRLLDEGRSMTDALKRLSSAG